jgi:hypothetical protein
LLESIGGRLLPAVKTKGGRRRFLAVDVSLNIRKINHLAERQRGSSPLPRTCSPSASLSERRELGLSEEVIMSIGIVHRRLRDCAGPAQFVTVGDGP